MTFCRTEEGKLKEGCFQIAGGVVILIIVGIFIYAKYRNKDNGKKEDLDYSPKIDSLDLFSLQKINDSIDPEMRRINKLLNEKEDEIKRLNLKYTKELSFTLNKIKRLKEEIENLALIMKEKYEKLIYEEGRMEYLIGTFKR